MAALVLALPSAALAQSAGDDQYQDPFAGQEQSQGGGGNSGGGNSGAGGGGGGGGQGDTAQASPSQAPSGDGSQGQAAQAGDALPRTGMPAFLLLAYGWVLLVGGVALRRAGRAGR